MNWFAGKVAELANYSGDKLVTVQLFDGQAFTGRLLCFSRGQVVPYHRDEHVDTYFDVFDGEGTILIDGREMRGVPGTVLYVPANVEHGFRADGTDRWTVREIVHERVYAGRAAKMVARAALRRLPVIGERLKRG